MLFAPYEHINYARNPLVEVICQFQFSTILSINSEEPAKFQEGIRQGFPRYAKGTVPLKTVNKDKTTTTTNVNNYQFVSDDGKWKINLTQNFISISTVGYTDWETFAQNLDQPLAHFIQTYSPGNFTRIGLRYVNAISKKFLGEEDVLWDDLMKPAYVGVLGEPDVEESSSRKHTVNFELALAGGYDLKTTAAPGLVGKDPQKRQLRFILDNDISVKGNLTVEQVPQKLEDMHRYAYRLFRGAITDELHEAMGPVYVADVES